MALGSPVENVVPVLAPDREFNQVTSYPSPVVLKEASALGASARYVNLCSDSLLVLNLALWVFVSYKTAITPRWLSRLITPPYYLTGCGDPALINHRKLASLSSTERGEGFLVSVT